MIRTDRVGDLRAGHPDRAAYQQVVQLDPGPAGRVGPAAHGGPVPRRGQCARPRHVQVADDRLWAAQARRQPAGQQHELNRAGEPVGQVRVHHPQRRAARCGQRDHLRGPADPVPGRPAQLDLLVAGDRQLGQHGQPPGAGPGVGADAEQRPAGVPGQPAVPDLCAQLGRDRGHQVWLRIRPPRLLQRDHVGLQPVARLGHIERLTAGGQAAMQVQAGQRDRLVVVHPRPGSSAAAA